MTQPNCSDRSSRRCSIDDFTTQIDRQTASSTFLVGIFTTAAIASSIAALYLFNLLPRVIHTSAPNSATNWSQPTTTDLTQVAN